MSGDLALPGADALLTGTAIPVGTLWAQLHTGDPGPNGTANVAAVSVRKVFSLTSSSGGVATNATQIQWLNVPNTETITHVTLWGASVADVCWFVDDAPNTGIFTGDSVTIVIGALSITFPHWT